MASTISRTLNLSDMLKLQISPVHVDTCLRWLDSLFDDMTKARPSEIRTDAGPSDVQVLGRAHHIPIDRFPLPVNAALSSSTPRLQPTKDYEELVRASQLVHFHQCHRPSSSCARTIGPLLTKRASAAKTQTLLGPAQRDQLAARGSAGARRTRNAGPPDGSCRRRR